MKETLLTITCGTVGAILINMTFGIIKTQWPANYYSTTQVAEYHVSRNWRRYLAFRLLPPYIIGTLTATTALRYGVNIWWTLGLCGAIHLGSTVGRSLIVGRNGYSATYRTVAVHAVITVLTLASLTLAGATSTWWSRLTPGPDKYVEVAITGLVAAALVHYLQKHTQHVLNVENVTGKALAEIPSELIVHLYRQCATHRVDSDFALAVLATELAQRPGWFRNLERLVSPLKLSRTHGVMQSSANANVSAADSITVAVEGLAGAVFPARGQHGTRPNEAELRYHLDRHNQGYEFQAFAIEVFNVLRYRHLGVTPYVGNDGTPGIRVLTKLQVSDEWVLTGDASLEVDVVEIMYDLESGVNASTGGEALPEKVGEPRTRWTARVSIFVDSVWISGKGELTPRPLESLNCRVQIHL